MTLDLSALPEKRRARVVAVFDRERAAERIRALYPAKLALYRESEAFARTAEVVRGEGFAFVSERWVRRVMQERR